MCKRQRSKPSSTPCCQLSVTSRVPALSPIPSPTKGGTRGPKSAPRWRWLAKLGRACSRRVGVSGPWRWTPEPCSPGRWLSAVTVLHSPPWLEMAAEWHLLGSSFTCVCPGVPLTLLVPALLSADVAGAKSMCSPGIKPTKKGQAGLGMR